MHLFHFEQPEPEDGDIIRESFRNIWKSIDNTNERLVEWLKRLGRKINQRLCPILNGGHELYRVHKPGRIFQQCLLCGHETKGWNLNKKLKLIKR